MVCCTGLVTSPSCFWSNFIKGWGTFAKILYSSKIGEVAFTICGWFSPNLSKLPDLDETMSRQVLKIALIKLVAVIELGPFLGALGPILTQNLALSQIWLAIRAWRPHSHISCQILLKNKELSQKFENHPKLVKMPGRASFSVILLKSPNLMKQCLWGFSSRRIQIRHENWDGTIFSTLSPIFTQLSFLPNWTNSIKWPKKRPRLWKHTIFFVTCDFYCSVRIHSFECVVWKKLAD